MRDLPQTPLSELPGKVRVSVNSPARLFQFRQVTHNVFKGTTTKRSDCRWQDCFLGDEPEGDNADRKGDQAVCPYSAIQKAALELPESPHSGGH